MIQELYNEYDFCSKHVHFSMFSVSQKFNFTDLPDGGKEYRLNYFELDPNDKKEPISRLRSLPRKEIPAPFTFGGSDAVELEAKDSMTLSIEHQPHLAC